MEPIDCVWTLQIQQYAACEVTRLTLDQDKLNQCIDSTSFTRCRRSTWHCTFVWHSTEKCRYAWEGTKETVTISLKSEGFQYEAGNVCYPFIFFLNIELDKALPPHSPPTVPATPSLSQAA